MSDELEAENTRLAAALAAAEEREKRMGEEYGKATFELVDRYESAEAALAAAEAALREAAIKVENDRTLWTPEWQTWLIDARAALGGDAMTPEEKLAELGRALANGHRLECENVRLTAALAAAEERANLHKEFWNSETRKAEKAEAALAAAGTDRQVWYDIGVEKAARWIEAQYSSCVWEKHLVAGIRALKRISPEGKPQHKPEHHEG